MCNNILISNIRDNDILSKKKTSLNSYNKNLTFHMKFMIHQGHSIERTTHSMEIAHEILTMYYATFTCPLSRSSRYCRHFEIR